MQHDIPCCDDAQIVFLDARHKRLKEKKWTVTTDSLAAKVSRHMVVKHDPSLVACNASQKHHQVMQPKILIDSAVIHSKTARFTSVFDKNFPSKGTP